MIKIGKQEREIQIKLRALTVKELNKVFIKNPSADNFATLEKVMLSYQHIVKNVRNA